jgi:capsular exopolysaccharide synthesis family protein
MEAAASETTSQLGSSGSTRGLLHKNTWIDYLWIIRDHWILATLVAVSLSGFYVFKKSQAIPLYRSSLILMVEVQKDQVINIEQVVDNSIARTGDYIMRNHLTDLRSNTFRDKVVNSLTEDELELIIKDYRTQGIDEDPSPHQIIAGSNHIKQIGVNIFNFEFHHRNPEAAALLANRFSEEFNDFLLERSRRKTESALRFLRSQSEELKLKVERSELAVQRYRQERNLVSLEESQNLIVERMKSLSGSLNEANVDLLQLSATINQIQDYEGDLDALAKVPAINQMGSLPSKFERRSALISERKALSLRYGRRHPRMIENSTALESLESEITTALQKNVSDFAEQYKNAEGRVSTLQGALKIAEKEALDLDQIAIEYNVLRRKLDTDTRLFTQVHQRLNEALLASQLTDTNLRVVDEAWAAREPFTPDLVKIYSIGITLGIILFVGIPFGIHYLNLNLKTAADIEERLGTPFIGQIQKFPKRLKQLHRLVLDQADPQGAELFRQIHSQILLKAKHFQKGHTFVVTSAVPKEGKSFFAINLATSFSRHHYKTFLMDADYRRPTIFKRMESELTSVDEVDSTIPGIRQMTENLHILPAMDSIHEATEWISSREFQEMVAELKRRYDIVIIDTPPAGLFPDAAMIGNHAQHFIFVTLLNKHRKRFLKGILDRLQQSEASVLGVVVNKISRKLNRNLGAYQYSDYKKYRRYYNIPRKK